MEQRVDHSCRPRQSRPVAMRRSATDAACRERDDEPQDRARDFQAMQRAMAKRRGQPPQPNAVRWLPYLVVFFVVCLGPIRPLLWRLVSELLSSEEPLPWYEEAAS